MEAILAGDIGGTNARLALFQAGKGAGKGKGAVSASGGEAWQPLAAKTYPSAGYPGLGAVIREFLQETGARPAVASLGVAGVIRGGRVDMVNLSWTVDASELGRDLGIPRVALLNDLEAAAWGVEALGPGGQASLWDGVEEPDGNRCLVSAGTGLGEAGLVRTPEGFLPFRSEGGHVNFAPRNPLEIELLTHLMGRYGHVSYERLVSGPGLLNIYAFLRDTGRGEEPAWLRERLEAEGGRAITACALEGGSELCLAAARLFVSIYGSAAGNMALKTLSTAGVWLGGGIAPRILPLLKEGGFREAFVSKGRLKGVMERIPVRVVTDDARLALVGAARAVASRTA